MILCLVSLGACIMTPDIHLIPTSLKDRQRQVRVYDMSDEISLLSAGVAVLQDMGFAVDESETSLGVVTASKVVESGFFGQTAASIGFLVLTQGKLKGRVDKKEQVRVNLITSPYRRSEKKYSVRITFQRVVWDTEDNISRVGTLQDDQLYRKFFQALSKSVFLEGHQI